MLVIRLFRTGKKNQPFFKIVVTDKRRPPRGGRFKEQVGFLNPLTKEKGLKTERIRYWLSKGAQPSDTVYNLLIKEGILQGKKIPLHKKKKTEGESKPEKKEEEKKEEEKKEEEKKEEEKKEEAGLEEAKSEGGKKEQGSEEEPEEELEEDEKEESEEKPKEEKRQENPNENKPKEE